MTILLFYYGSHGKMDLLQEVSEAKLVFPDITETSKPVGLHEVGHCILRPTGYFYAEIKEQPWCIKCGALCIPSTFCLCFCLTDRLVEVHLQAHYCGML